MNEKTYPLAVHFHELRRCLIRSCLAVSIVAALCYGFSDQLLHLIKKPILEVLGPNAQFIVLSPTEYFFTQLKVSLFLGLVFSSPFVFSQIWLFVAPGLYKKEKRFLLIFVSSATACFLLGALFAYFLVFPPMFRFFVDSLPSDIEASYSIGMIYSFAISMLLAFGAVFQTPLAVFLLVMTGTVDLETIKKARRYVLVGSFIVGAILTPPDPLTQVMLAVPTYLLFEAGIFFTGLILSRKVSKKLDPDPSSGHG